MMSKGQIAAKKLMEQHGLEHVNDIPIELIASGLGATIVEKPLTDCDGRIVFGENRAAITINSNIEYPGKKRFTIAHEIGHLCMHKDHFKMHNDTDQTLEYFKQGNQEGEANDFASELLMPASLFTSISEDYDFDPTLLRFLADKFTSSITSVAYRYFECGHHPICLVYSYNNEVLYWKRHEDFGHFLKNRTKLPPPEGSIAAEFFNHGKIYPKDESAQEVDKSTWFELRDWERDQDFTFYEYCIVTPKYSTVLSVIWEEANLEDGFEI